MDKLTAKQQKFVDVYAGNATEAARKAGYDGNEVTLGQVGAENLKKPQIVKAIRDRRDTELAPFIASRIERQAFWTAAMNDDKLKMENRLKASELLGKSEGDFIERVDLNPGGPIKVEWVVKRVGKS